MHSPSMPEKVTKMSRSRLYSEMAQFRTFEERFEYLSLGGEVGAETFGFERWMNQAFYRSHEWRTLRNHVISRDNGLDLGVAGFPIFDRVLIHHINPITAEDIERGAPALLDMDNLISVSHKTHNAIHYGDKTSIRQPWKEREPNDTTPWRR